MIDIRDANLRTKLSVTGAGGTLRAANGPAGDENALLRGLIKSGAKLRTKLSAMLPAERAAVLMAIEAERIAMQVPRARFALEAGVSAPHFERLVRAAGRGVTTRFLMALMRGVKAVKAQDAAAAPVDIAAARTAYAACLAAAARAFKTDVGMVELLLKRRGEHPADAAWRLASKVRALALYLASTTVGIRGFMLAALTGLTPAAVSLSLNRIEELRDDDAYEATIEQAAQQVRGE